MEEEIKSFEVRGKFDERLICNIEQGIENS
jgi:hypothetical protein